MVAIPCPATCSDPTSSLSTAGACVRCYSQWGKTLCLPPRGLRRKKKHTHYKTTRGLSQERKTALDCMNSGGILSGDRWVREQQALGLDLETDRIWKRQSSWLKARFKGECPLGPLTNNFNMETSLLYQDDIFILCVCVYMKKYIFLHVSSILLVPLLLIVPQWIMIRRIIIEHIWVEYNCRWIHGFVSEIYASTMHPFFLFSFLNSPLNSLVTYQPVKC